ncbi:zinc ribbon domain-containing protein [Bradyrhizobium sp. 49]|nr:MULTISPECIES: zinc ribbon domain-containing protein [unclassified Bradyrhizobium]MCK1268930.1 zinc ribbon domain-containing protein [Bradyrhizobium sp. 84]MCK1371079.1 zinc ribbon domain-containing protein [Bradyrhizobium sp. 49]
MSVLHPIRKACPSCGRPMKLVSQGGGRDRYVCPHCVDDPLHDPAALKWADSPLRPPADPKT